jgi:putative ABC transport system substrate-binding protein
VNPGSTPSLPLIIDSVKTAAGALSLQLQIFEARRPEDFDAAFAAMAAQKVGTLLVIGDSMFFFHRARLGELALKH